MKTRITKRRMMKRSRMRMRRRIRMRRRRRMRIMAKDIGRLGRERW
jgi:hypothetical protein